MKYDKYKTLSKAHVISSIFGEKQRADQKIELIQKIKDYQMRAGRKFLSEKLEQELIQIIHEIPDVIYAQILEVESARLRQLSKDLTNRLHEEMIESLKS